MTCGKRRTGARKKTEMKTRPAIPEVVREARDRLRLLYGEKLRHVILYGSHARGDADEGSDIDLLIVLKELHDPEAESSSMDPIASELSLEHDTVLCFLPIAERDYLERNTPLLLNIRREGVPV